MAVTAGFVLAATVIAERVGPLIGGLVATLPIGAGPACVFLGLDHDAHFIAQSAVVSMPITAPHVTYALIYGRLAQAPARAAALALAFFVCLLLAPSGLC